MKEKILMDNLLNSTDGIPCINLVPIDTISQSADKFILQETMITQDDYHN